MNILAIRMDNIGDVVMVEPALRAIRKAYPQAKLTLLASPAGSQVAPLIPWVDQVISWRASWQELSEGYAHQPSEDEELIQQLRAGHYDLALIFTSFTQSAYPPAYACYLAGIPNRVGMSTEFGGAILTRWVKPPEIAEHQVERNLSLIKALGIPLDGTDIRLTIPPDVDIQADKLLQSLGIVEGTPFVTLLAGASASARRYPAQRYRQVAEGLVERAGVKVLLLGTSKEKEHIEPVIQAVDNRNIFSLIGETDVPLFAALISKSALVVANNSSGLHFADAFHRPMVILYSGTEYRSQWAPRNSPAILLKRETRCSPCFKLDCPYQMECLDIEPDEVTRLSVDLLKKNLALQAGSNHLLVEDLYKNAINGYGSP